MERERQMELLGDHLSLHREGQCWPDECVDDSQTCQRDEVAGGEEVQMAVHLCLDLVRPLGEELEGELAW